MFRWGRDAWSRARRRMGAQGWQVLQTALAATVAWVIAVHVAGHPRPFFAPISAMVALTAARGERGTTAVRLVLGVVVGIVVADLVLFVLGSTLWAMPISVFLAMMTAAALHSARTMLMQAASSAVLTLVFASGAAGWQRLVDALIGAGVALVVVQLIFPPDPVRLLRRSVKAALAELASGLDAAARALEDDDEDAARQAQEHLWEDSDQLSALAQARLFSRRIAQRVPLRRSLRERVSSEGESARLLNLLNASCILLIRAAFALSDGERERFAPVLRGLGEAIGGLADDPADQACRQAASERALDAVRPLGETPPASHPFLATAVMAARMVAVDLLMFTGSDPSGALAAVRSGKDDPAVPPPPTG
ncbi:FUSC family protein [Actinocorallia populi]|uniref:FUSC family protein n=1 Tax=Actinocorallia populi TaxID=2079200 RepID=UPI001300390B|nr:FUSC family protein [Actinocorallia populi]